MQNKNNSLKVLVVAGTDMIFSPHLVCNAEDVRVCTLVFAGIGDQLRSTVGVPCQVRCTQDIAATNRQVTEGGCVLGRREPAREKCTGAVFSVSLLWCQCHCINVIRY
jgi:hypothetical protein